MIKITFLEESNQKPSFYWFTYILYIVRFINMCTNIFSPQMVQFKMKTKIKQFLNFGEKSNPYPSFYLLTCKLLLTFCEAL